MELKTSSQVSKAFGISTRMLRYYEQAGLIKGLRKDHYAYRLYDEDSIKRLQQIIILRKLQLPIKQISVILSSPKAETAIRIFKDSISEIENDITALKIIKSALKVFVAKIEEMAAVHLSLNLLDDDSVCRLAASIFTHIDKNSKGNDLSKASKTLEKAKGNCVRVVYYPPEAIAYLPCEAPPNDDAKAELEKFVKSVDLLHVKPDFRCLSYNGKATSGYALAVTIPENLLVAPPLKKGFIPGGLYAAVTITPNNKNDWSMIEAWLNYNEDYMNDQGAISAQAMDRPSHEVYFNPLNQYGLAGTTLFDTMCNPEYADLHMPIRQKEAWTKIQRKQLAAAEQSVLCGKVTDVDLSSMLQKADFHLEFLGGCMIIKSAEDYHGGMVTAQSFALPLKIELCAMTDTTDIILSLTGDIPGCLNINAGDFRKPLVLFDTDKVYPYNTKEIPVNKFVNIEWLLGRDIMAIKINGQLRVLGSAYGCVRAINETPGRRLSTAVCITSARSATISVKSLRITEL